MMKKILLAALPLLALSAAPALAQGEAFNGNFGVTGLTGLSATLGGGFDGMQLGGARVGGSSAVAGGTIGNSAGSMTASQASSEAAANSASAVTGFINPGTMQFGGTAQTSFGSSSGGFGTSNLGGVNSFAAGSIGGAVAGMVGQLGLTGMIQFAPAATP
jgi:hypothetical protein